MPYKNKGLSADFSRSWEYVTVPQRFRSARWKFTFEAGVYSIALVALNVVPVGEQGQRGGTGKADVIHMRAPSLAALRESIEKAFPDAVFSQVGPTDEIKNAHAVEVKKQQEARAKELEQFQLVERVTAEHRELASKMTPQQLAAAVEKNIRDFVLTTDWKDWFKDHRNGAVGFLDFPNNEGRNRATLLEICNHRGQILPLFGELDSAMRYALSNNHFYLRNTYKRSMQDEMNAVVPYSGDVANARVSTFSDAQAAEARKKLQAALPPGIKVPEETIRGVARELGISPSLLNAVMGKTGSLIEANNLRGNVVPKNPQAKPDVSNLSSADIKRELARQRPLVDPALRRRGY